MSDDLRIRIGAAIMASCHGVYLDDAVDAADAVIRELRPERRCDYCGRTGTQKFIKTGTGWVCRSVYACNRRANR